MGFIEWRMSKAVERRELEEAKREAEALGIEITEDDDDYQDTVR